MRADAFALKAKGGTVDMSRTCLLNNTFNTDGSGFMAAEGWILGMWEKTLALMANKGTKEITLHRDPGDVLLVHNKVYVNSVGIIMLVELQWRPYLVDVEGPVLLVRDNVGVHNAEVVVNGLRALIIIVLGFDQCYKYIWYLLFGICSTCRPT